MKTYLLDLGCGETPRNHYKADRCIGIDLVGNQQNSVIAHDLGFGTIPFEDKTFDYVTAFDFIEHVSRHTWSEKDNRHVNSFIVLMNEISRVLKLNGRFFHKTPCYPHAEVFMDPTHLNYVSEKTIAYFARIPTASHDLSSDAYGFLKPLAKSYGIDTRFTLVSSKIDGFHLEQELLRY